MTKLLVFRYLGTSWKPGTVDKADYEALTEAQKRNYKVKGEFSDREAARAAYREDVERRARGLSRMARGFTRRREEG